MSQISSRNIATRVGKWALATGVTVFLTIIIFFGGIAWWIDSSDAPARSDQIVILAGAYSRSFYAADLYAQGYAPEIWVSRPKPTGNALSLLKAGLSSPAEPEIHK